MHTSALSCGLLLFHSKTLLSSNPPMRFGAEFLECGHTGLAPPTQDNPPNMFPASRAPSNTCTCPHATLWAHNAPICAVLSILGTWAMPSPVWGLLNQKPHCNVGAISGTRGDLDQLSRSRHRASPFAKFISGLDGFFVLRGAADSACVMFHPIRWCLHIHIPACGIQSVSPGRAAPDPVQGAKWDRDS